LYQLVPQSLKTLAAVGKRGFEGGGGGMDMNYFFLN